MDLYLRVHEWIATRDWDPWRPWIIGSLNAALLISQVSIQSEDWTDALLMDSRLSSVLDQRMLADPFEQESWLSFFVTLLLGQTTWSRILRWSLLALSIWNLYQTIRSSKELILFKQPTGPLHASDTSWIVNSPNARLVLIDIDPHMADPPISSHHSSPRTTPIDWLKRRKKPDHQKKRVPRKEERWALRVWAPTDWQLGLLTYLSPVHVLLVWFVSDENWGTMVPLFLLNAGMTAIVASLWIQLGKDTQILHGQLVQEFSDGFVYRLSPFLVKRSVGVQASPELGN